MIADLLTHPVTVTRLVPTGTKDKYGKPIVDVTTESAFGYAQIETQFADPASGLDGNSVRIFLPAATVTDFISSIEIEGQVYEPRGKGHLQWNPRTRGYAYIMFRGRVAD